MVVVVVRTKSGWSRGAWVEMVGVGTVEVSTLRKCQVCAKDGKVTRGAGRGANVPAIAAALATLQQTSKAGRARRTKDFSLETCREEAHQ